MLVIITILLIYLSVNIWRYFNPTDKPVEINNEYLICHSELYSLRTQFDELEMVFSYSEKNSNDFISWVVNDGWLIDSIEVEYRYQVWLDNQIRFDSDHFMILRDARDYNYNDSYQ